jgi:acetate kinase
MRSYQIIKYIGSYVAALGGLDGLVFTAGVGENQPLLRAEVIEALGYLGMKLDAKANEVHGQEMLITAADSAIPAWVIPTDEEMVIARDTAALA